MPRSERLIRLVESVEAAEAEFQLGAAIAEMDDLLAEAGLELESDLTVDEYIATVEHIDRYVDGLVEAVDIGIIDEGSLKGKLKAGFKMVFGKLVKVGKRLIHKGLAKYNNYRADRAQTTANKFRSKARSHSASASNTYRKSGPRKRKTSAGTRARTALGKPAAKRGHKTAAKGFSAKPKARRSTRMAKSENTEHGSDVDEGIRAGFKMVFGKLVKLKNRLLKQKTKPGGDSQIFRHDQVQQHKTLHKDSDDLRKSMAASKRARDKYLSQGVDGLRDNLVDGVLTQYVTQLADMAEDAGYETVPPEDATLSDFIENVEAFIEDPDSDLDEAARRGMRMVFGKLRKIGRAGHAQAKLQGKYKRYRRERHGQTSRGGQWAGK